MRRFIVILCTKYAYTIHDGRTQSGYTLIDMMFDKFLNKWNKISEIFQSVIR